MALSTQRKAYIGILVVAVGAFGVDQLFLQGSAAPPGPASAAAAAPAAPAAPIEIPATIPGKAARSLGELAERIEKLRVSLDARSADADAFILPAGWRPPAPAKDPATKEPPAPRRTAEEVRAQLKVSLTVIGHSQSGSRALITAGGDVEARRTYEVGERVAGCIVREIRADAVVVEVQETGERVHIPVDKDSVKSIYPPRKDPQSGPAGPDQVPAQTEDKKAPAAQQGV